MALNGRAPLYVNTSTIRDNDTIMIDGRRKEGPRQGVEKNASQRNQICC